MLKISSDARHCLLAFGCTSLRQVWLPVVLQAAEDQSHIPLQSQPFLLQTGNLSPVFTSCPKPWCSCPGLGLTHCCLWLGSPGVDPGREQLLAALCWGSLVCFSFHCLKGALLTHLQQVFHLGSWSAELPALPGNLQFALLQGLLLSHVEDLASVLINFMKFLSARKDVQCVLANPSSFPSQDISYLSVFEF